MEIDYKEKYEQAIWKLRGMIPNWERLSYNGKTFLQDLIHIFPELKESEDEKIRKALIQLVKKAGEGYENVSEGISIQKAIAWLEKQHKPADKVEQKPAWSEEDEINLENAMWYVKNPAPKVVKDSMLVEWLKSLKDRVLPQPKQEWSKQDETLLNCCLGAINTTDYFDKDNKDEMKNWLMFLKERVQPQSHWKPSENELEVLRLVAEKDGTCLMGLYENLKKLREE